MTAFFLRARWLIVCALLALVIVALRASHLIFPNLWLPSSATSLEVGDVKRVDAHLYDSQWFDAARAGRQDITQVLLQAGYPINTQTGSGYTALILATYHGHAAEVAMLLQSGADSCIADNNGNTALMGALFKGELDIARRLLSLCPIDQANNNGQTALAFAALFGRLQIVPTLVGLGADINHLDNSGKSVLAIVLAQGNDLAAAALRRAGAR